MSTRNMIGMEMADGTVRAIYCHYDGHPSHNGRNLSEFYSVAAVLSEVIALGALSYLGETPAQCSAYVRDRGERGPVRVEVYDSAEAYFIDPHDAEWVYLARPDGERVRWEVGDRTYAARQRDPDRIAVAQMADLLAQLAA